MNFNKKKYIDFYYTNDLYNKNQLKFIFSQKMKMLLSNVLVLLYIQLNLY
jgi:hypothetical protein